MKLDIRYAKKEDLSFVDFLQKKNARDLSFYPLSILEREIENSRVLLALVNNQHAGYLFHGSVQAPRGGRLRIFQACIEYDLRGQWYGAGLVKTLEDKQQVGLFDEEEKELTPSNKKRNSSLWRKRDEKKKSNMMLRGKALLDYRKSIIEGAE